MNSISHRASSSFALIALLVIATAASAVAQDIKRRHTDTPKVTMTVGRARAITRELKTEAPIKAVVVSKAISNDAQVHYKLANEYLEQQKTDLAIGEYNKAVKASVKFADAWYGLG